MALGLTHYFNPDRAVNLGASVGGDRVHFRLGAAFRMGDRNDEKVINTPRTQDARLISKLQEENKAQDELIRELQRQIDELKESIKK